MTNNKHTNYDFLCLSTVLYLTCLHTEWFNFITSWKPTYTIHAMIAISSTGTLRVFLCSINATKFTPNVSTFRTKALRLQLARGLSYQKFRNVRLFCQTWLSHFCFKRLSLQKRTNQNLIRNRFCLNFLRKYKNVFRLRISDRFSKFLISSPHFVYYQPPSTSKCRPFSIRKLFNFGNQTKNNFYSNFKYLRILYKIKIERMKIHLNLAGSANLKFAYFEE